MTAPTTLALLTVGTTLVTVVLAPLAYRALLARSVLDVPNHRSSHDRPTVRGGGVACIGALVVVWVTATSVGVDLPQKSLMAALVLSLIGFADDVWGLPAASRLIVQALVGMALGASLGGPETALLGALAVPVTVNAINFMDGINGITGLTVAAWACVILLAGSAVAGGATVLAALALGPALGFLPWNLPRARMFLGDSGSYLFGGVVAAALLESGAHGGSLLLVIAPFALYLFDTGYTLVQRARRGAPVLAAHREHLYQRLAASERWSHAGVSALAASLALTIGGAFLLLPITLALVGVATVFLAYWLLTMSSSRVLQGPTAS